jgi:hypothetical protein
MERNALHMHWQQMTHTKTSVGGACGAAGVSVGRLGSDNGEARGGGAGPHNGFHRIHQNTHRVSSMNLFIGVGKGVNTSGCLGNNEFR